MSPSKLQEILELHLRWLKNESGGIRANLAKANLSGAELTRAHLSGADLSRADLSGADLSGADLSRVDLTGADLTGSNLSKANLSGSYLSGAHLSGADLSGTIMLNFSIVPEIGSFYCFKKLKSGEIATLYVPKSARRLGGLLSRKCRVSKVKVIDISGGIIEDYDKHTGQLLYKVGCWVKPDKFDDNILVECTSGIHVFITRKEAKEY